MIVAESGHVVAYSGDDERFDYLYKFVSKDKYREGDRKHNMTLLSEGNLYVAKFTGNSPAAEIDGKGTVPADGSFDGTGEWLPLVVDGESMVAGHDRRGGPGLHPPGRRQGGPHQDGPLRGRRAQPAHRQGLRGLHQQLGPRQGGQGRRHRESTRATRTATATSWKSPRPATRPPPSSPGTC